MKISMDGIRRNLTIDANKLGELIDLDSKPEVTKAFNNLAQTINSLNCIYDDTDKEFNELPETIIVYTLLNEEE